MSPVNQPETRSPAGEAAALRAPTACRLLSLDVFRGATIAAMMLVNNPGSWTAVYPPLLHAPWHGWTFTDLVFPFFLWIVGVAIPLSVARRLERGDLRSDLFRHAFRRALILFALGLFLNSFSFLIDGSFFRLGLSGWIHEYLTTVRIPGVLQRIAICYLVASGLYLVTGVRGQVAAVFLLLAGYWVLMAFVPVPGHGAGVFEKERNFSQYIDNLLLNGPVIGTHVWKTAKTWDPEGIVSTLPAITSCLFGVLAGQLLRAKLSQETKTAWLFTAGCALLCAGQVMHPFLPINKNIWTSSYAVFMAGMATLCFAVCFWLVDVQGWRRGTRPLAIYGMNAITVFVLAGVIGRLMVEIKVDGTSLKVWLYEHSFAALIPDPRLASLFWAVAFMLMLYGIAYAMHRRNWFLKF